MVFHCIRSKGTVFINTRIKIGNSGLGLIVKLERLNREKILTIKISNTNKYLKITEVLSVPI